MSGLKKLRDGPPAQLRRDISLDQLRRGMDIVFPPNSPENVNIRAMVSTQMQGLMRGREAGCEHVFDQAIDLARGDKFKLARAHGSQHGGCVGCVGVARGYSSGVGKLVGGCARGGAPAGLW